MGNYLIGIDIGGTFTDLVLFDLDNGSYEVKKVASTPADPSKGFINGLELLMTAAKIEPADVRYIFHGTTVATNAILEMESVDIGLIVSKGFRHVLEIARHGTPRLVNPNTWTKPAPPVPAEQVVEVPERVGFDGTVITPLDEEVVRRAAREFRDAGIGTVAVSLIHSYVNPKHERRVRELLLEEHPLMQVSLSSDILPVFREYERTMTTVLNAYVAPRVSQYIATLRDALKRLGFGDRLVIMKSNGGLMGGDTARQFPVYTALSGPAAGVVAGEQIALASGYRDIVTFDMGGTSTDVALVSQGRAMVTSEGTIGKWPMQLPMRDINTIGAGAGSIASLTEAGHLTVGPRSAGADPGPACYGWGGMEPTVTDANLVLGRIGDALAGGSVGLDAGMAREVLDRKIARPLGLSVEEAANGIIQIVNNNMMGAIRSVTIQKGHDPREFVLVSFGGSGPVHAVEVAGLLGIPAVLVPRYPGLVSAFGVVMADFQDDYARTLLEKPPNYNLKAIEQVYRELELTAKRWLEKEGIPPEKRSMERSADLRYTHQGMEVTVPFQARHITPETVEGLVSAFHKEHLRLYSFALERQPVEIVTLRVKAMGHTPKPRPLENASTDQLTPPIGKRSVYFDSVTGYVDVPVYRREYLPPKFSVVGPALLDQDDSTVVVPPSWAGQVDQPGNLLLSRED